VEFTFASLIRTYPYSTHTFYEFKPGGHIHFTHRHITEHSFYCKDWYWITWDDK